MVRAIRCHRQNMKSSIINGSEVSRLSVAIQWSCKVWYHLCGQNNIHRYTYWWYNRVYPNVTCWRARRACPTPLPFRSKFWTDSRFRKQINKNKYNYQKYFLDTFSDSAEMSRMNNIYFTLIVHLCRGWNEVTIGLDWTEWPVCLTALGIKWRVAKRPQRGLSCF